MSEDTQVAKSKWFDDLRAPEAAGKPAPPRSGPKARYYRRRGNGQARAQVIAFVTERLNAGSSPTAEDVRVHMGWKNRQSAIDCLRKVVDALPVKFDRSEIR